MWMISFSSGLSLSLSLWMISFSSGLSLSLSVSLSLLLLVFSHPSSPSHSPPPPPLLSLLFLFSLNPFSLPLSLSVVRFLRTPPTDITDDVDIGGKEGKRV